MNYNNINPYTCNLLSRNEGKIKSYDSCLDVRGWSHDIERRDRYLKEWIKGYMPISVIPVSTLVCIVNNMTCSSKSLVTPRCHANCKSKVLLESICNSCNEIEECFRNDQAFHKYFENEQFETSHWPCERCLDALKSIKTFWKIMVEKIFNINMPKSHQIYKSSSCCADDVRSVAKVWQSDMKRQTAYVKNYKTLLCNTCPTSSDFSNTSSESNKSRFTKCCKTTDTCDLTGNVNNSGIQTLPHNQRMSRHTSTIFLNVDTACSCTDLKDEFTTYKVNLNCLREELNKKHDEIQRLKSENKRLKVELQTFYNNSWWKRYMYSTPASSCIPADIDNIPKPFDHCECLENINTATTKPIESEMIITMKNGKNEDYKHISLVQVVHKTNTLNVDLSQDSNKCCRKENPIALLEKVQNTFEAIVSREMSRANDNVSCDGSLDIDAIYHKTNACQSMPSRSTTNLTTCDSCFDTRRLEQT